jgi:CRP/FNR family cyclic AMP-dependent transcriptional regulator
MPCDIEALKQVPFFGLLDDDELTVLASQVEQKTFGARQRIYKIGDTSLRAYIIVSGAVRVTTIDEDNQEVLVDQPGQGEFFGFASMIAETPHQTQAFTTEETTCIEIDRHDIGVLLQRKPDAGLDIMAVLGRQFQSSQHLVRVRANRNPNEMIEEEATFGERVADTVASFGGSWTFIVAFAITLAVYAFINVRLASRAWDPYPFILLNLFLSMLAAVQAPVIMMSQNRQDKKDRLRSELDFDVNRRAHSEIQGLANKINLLGDRIGDIEDTLRAKPL